MADLAFWVEFGANAATLTGAGYVIWRAARRLRIVMIPDPPPKSPEIERGP